MDEDRQGYKKGVRNGREGRKKEKGDKKTRLSSTRKDKTKQGQGKKEQTKEYRSVRSIFSHFVVKPEAKQVIAAAGDGLTLDNGRD